VDSVTGSVVYLTISANVTAMKHIAADNFDF